MWVDRDEGADWESCGCPCPCGTWGPEVASLSVLLGPSPPARMALQPLLGQALGDSGTLVSQLPLTSRGPWAFTHLAALGLILLICEMGILLLLQGWGAVTEMVFAKLLLN